MLISKEQIIDTISKMTITDIVDLVSMIEKKFDISTKNTESVSIDNLNEEKQHIEDKTEFSIFLNKIGPNKIAVIKSVRASIGLGLKEAKDLVESAPVLLKENINKNDAEIIKKTLEDLGASIEIK